MSDVLVADRAEAEVRARLDPQLWVLFVGRFITAVGHSISFPFFALYCHGSLGVSMSIVGAIIFTGGLLGAFGKFLGGTLSDRWGRKRVMLASLAGRTLAMAAFGVLAASPRPPLLAVAGLFVAGMWAGFLFEPASQAMVADLADARKRLFGYSLMRVGGNLGWAIGAVVGGIIGALSYSAMFLTTAGVIFAALVLVALWVRESLPDRSLADAVPAGSAVDCLRVPGFLVLCAATLLISIVMAQLIAPLSVYAQDHLGLAPQQAGLMFTLNGLMIVFFQFPVAKVIAKARMTTALVAGSLLYAVGYALAGWTVGFWTLASCVLVVSCGELLVAPSTLSLAANVVGADRRGGALGVFGFFEMMGRCVGPLLGGIALDLFAARPWVHWAIVGTIGLAAAIGFYAVRSRVAPAVDRGVA